MATEWVPLTGDEQLKTGDVVRVWYRIIGAGQVLEGWQLDKIATDVERRNERFFVRSYSMPDIEHKGFLVIEIREPREPELQRAGVGAYVIAGLVGSAVTAAFIAAKVWSVHNMEGRNIVEDVVETTTETVHQTAWTLAQWAAVAIVGYIAVKSVQKGGGGREW